MELDDYSGNLGWAALDPEPINRLPEKSGDARDFGRDKASPQQTIRRVSPEQPAQSKASGLCQTYKVWTRKMGNTEVQKENISAILIPKICITWPKQLSKVGDWHVWKYGPSASVTYRGGWEGNFACTAQQNSCNEVCRKVDTKFIPTAHAYTERGDRCPLDWWFRLNWPWEKKLLVAFAKAWII